MLNALPPTLRRWALLLRLWWLSRRVKSAMGEIETMRETAAWLDEQAALHQRYIQRWCAEIMDLDDAVQALDKTADKVPHAQV